MSPQLLQQSRPLALQPRQLGWLAALAAALLIGVVAPLLVMWQPRVGLALLCVPFAALAVRFPRQAVYLFVFAFPLTIGLPRGSFGIPILRITELALVGMFVLVLLSSALRNEWQLNFGTIDLAVLFMFLAGTVIPVIVAQGNSQEITSANWNDYFGVIRFYLCYRLIRMVVERREHVIRILHCWFAASVIVGVVAVLQNLRLFGVYEFTLNYYMDASFRDFVQESWRNPDLFRATSLLRDWNTLGSFSAFTLIFAIFYAQTLRGLKSLLWMVPVLAANGVALMLSGNISSMAAVCAAVVIGALVLRRIPKAVVPVLIVLPFVLIVFSNFIFLRFEQQFGGNRDDYVVAQSLTYRIYLWQTQLLPALEGRELFGVGPNLPEQIWWTTEESQYIGALYSGGIIYLSAYLLWTFLAIGVFIKALRNPDPLARMIGLAGASIIFVLYFMGIVNAYANYTAAMTIVWFMFGAVALAPRWSRAPTLQPQQAAQPVRAPEHGAVASS
jgi:hypothetical protein